MIVTWTCEKGPDGRGLLTKEEKMCRIITESELAKKTDIELSALFRKVSREIANSKIGSAERRNALVSLENISRAMRTRYIAPHCSHPKPPGF